MPPQILEIKIRGSLISKIAVLIVLSLWLKIALKISPKFALICPIPSEYNANKTQQTAKNKNLEFSKKIL